MTPICFVTVNAHYVYVYNQSNNNKVIHGYCYPLSKLYIVPLYQDLNQVPRVTPQPVPTVELLAFFSIYYAQSVSSLINFLHCTCLSLLISIWIKAVQHGYLVTFPCLINKRIWKNCTKKMKTTKEHMCLIPSNVWSTCIHSNQQQLKKHNVNVFITDDTAMKKI